MTKKKQDDPSAKTPNQEHPNSGNRGAESQRSGATHDPNPRTNPSDSGANPRNSKESGNRQAPDNARTTIPASGPRKGEVNLPNGRSGSGQREDANRTRHPNANVGPGGANDAEDLDADSETPERG